MKHWAVLCNGLKVGDHGTVVNVLPINYQKTATVAISIVTVAVFSKVFY